MPIEQQRKDQNKIYVKWNINFAKTIMSRFYRGTHFPFTNKWARSIGPLVLAFTYINVVNYYFSARSKDSNFKVKPIIFMYLCVVTKLLASY